MPVALRIATLNVWALPFGFARHVAQRMPAIVAHAGEGDVDVLALQEVWTRRARSLLIDAGERIGLVPAGDPTRSPGGLLTLTRLPVRQTEFIPYLLPGLPQRPWHADYYGRKGFALVQVDTAAGPAMVVNTHLHARYTKPGEFDPYLGIRTAQVLQLVSYLSTVRGPVVAVGDFNIREDDPEYRCLRSHGGLADAAADLDKRRPTSLLDNPYSGSGHEPAERIDYVFTRGGAQTVAIRRDFDAPLEAAAGPATYSDHAGLVADVSIQAGEGAVTGGDRQSMKMAKYLLNEGIRITVERGRRERAWVAGLLLPACLGSGLPRTGRVGRTLSWAGLAVGAAWLTLVTRVGRRERRGYQKVAAMLGELMSCGE
jgi:endonuclease/exonuclease/phosphatase family metal-dependent hydrolase